MVGTFGEANGVPAFLAKLWRLVDDESNNDLIYWSSVRKKWLRRVKVAQKTAANIFFSKSYVNSQLMARF